MKLYLKRKKLFIFFVEVKATDNYNTIGCPGGMLNFSRLQKREIRKEVGI